MFCHERNAFEIRPTLYSSANAVNTKMTRYWTLHLIVFLLFFKHLSVHFKPELQKRYTYKVYIEYFYVWYLSSLFRYIITVNYVTKPNVQHTSSLNMPPVDIDEKS